MARSLEILKDVCVDLPHTARAMFGGHGFFAPNGGMFAGIVTDDEVVLKLVDEAAKNELIALGGHPWVYQSRNGPMTMGGWIVVPDGFYDDHETFSAWAKRAHALAPGKAKPAAASKKTKKALPPRLAKLVAAKKKGTKAAKPQKPSRSR